MDNFTRTLGDIGGMANNVADDVKSKVIDPAVSFMGKRNYLPSVMMQKPDIDIRPFLKKIRIV